MWMDSALVSPPPTRFKWVNGESDEEFIERVAECRAGGRSGI